MKILCYEPKVNFHCLFNGYLFELELDQYPEGNLNKWYMVVRDNAGNYVCDGYIPESNDYGARQAMIEACKIASIDPPKIWNGIK